MSSTNLPATPVLGLPAAPDVNPPAKPLIEFPPAPVVHFPRIPGALDIPARTVISKTIVAQRSRIARLEKDIASLQATVAARDATIQQQNAFIDSKNEDISALKTRVTAPEKDIIDQHASHILSYKELLDKFQATNQEVIASNEEVVDSYKAIGAQVRGLTASRTARERRVVQDVAVVFTEGIDKVLETQREMYGLEERSMVERVDTYLGEGSNFAGLVQGYKRQLDDAAGPPFKRAQFDVNQIRSPTPRLGQAGDEADHGDPTPADGADNDNGVSEAGGFVSDGDDVEEPYYDANLFKLKACDGSGGFIDFSNLPTAIKYQLQSMALSRSDWYTRNQGSRGKSCIYEGSQMVHPLGKCDAACDHCTKNGRPCIDMKRVGGFKTAVLKPVCIMDRRGLTSNDDGFWVCSAGVASPSFVYDSWPKVRAEKGE